jgi:serine/threonine protein kinase/tetratricopeptide (TPR) repeat protein
VPATAPILLGRFRLEGEIGRGAMGAVHRGVHTGSGVPVAIKVIEAAFAGDDGFRAAFRDEVRAAAALDHPGIVMVFDQGEIGAEAAARSGGALAEGAPYFVMELVPHGTLHDAGVVEERLSWPWLRGVLVALLDALAHAHARGVVHRDIKPGNVLLAGPGAATAVKLTDFGIAHRIEEGATKVRHATAGTPHYMAPEQIAGSLHHLGPWTDLYAVGCLAYRLAGGRPPFWEHRSSVKETLRRHRSAPVPPLRSRVPVPAGLDAWLRGMLAKAPARRFRVAADAAAALLDLGDPAPPSSSAIAAVPAISFEESTRIVAASSDPTLAPSSGPAQGGAADDGDAAPRCVPAFPETWRAADPPRRSTALAGAGLALFALRPAPFVGRDRERDALWRALGAVHAARAPRVVIVRGPAGVGKTRLGDWLATRAREVGAASVLSAFHAAAPGSADGLGPMVARALRTAGLPRREAAAVTEEAVLALGGDVADAALALEITHPRVAEASPDEDDDGAPRVRFAGPRERHRAICRVVDLFARERPAIVRVEDAQWAPDALAFAAELCASGLPALCLLGVSDEALADRPAEADALAALSAHPAAETIALAPLDDGHHADLVRGLLGLASSLAADVARRTSGNPLFAVQLVGDWVERGVLDAGEEGFVLAPGADAALPDDIHALWLRRITRAVAGSEPAFASVERAAALGQVVGAEEWARAAALSGLPLPADLGPALELHGLLRRDGRAWAFCHGMLVESLARHARDAGRWEDHHRACAAALGSGAPGIAERVAAHLEAAGDLEAALAPALSAAWERHEASDFAAALNLLDRRDAWIDRLGLPDADPRRAWGWMRRALVLTRIARVRDAAPFVERAEAAARAHGHDDLLAEALYVRARTAQMAARAAEGIAVFEEARARFEALGDRRGVARCDHGLAELFPYASRAAEARARFEAALAGYAAGGDRLAHAMCRMALAHHEMQSLGGDREAGVALMLEAERELAAVGHRFGVARACVFLGHHKRILEKRLDEAEAYYARAAALYEAVGSADAAIPWISMAIVHLLRGAHAQATPLAERAHASFEADAREGYLIFSHAVLLPCRAAARDWARFDAHAAAVEAIVARTSFADDDVELGARLAEDLARRAGEEARAGRAGAIARAQRAALGMPEPPASS